MGLTERILSPAQVYTTIESGMKMGEKNNSCEIQIRVRYPEVDQMGALHHSRYWVYFEMGRIELLRLKGASYRDIEAGGVFLVVARVSANFHTPARYDEELTLRTSMVNMGQVRIEHEYELIRNSDQALIATAKTTIASVDRQGKIIPLPESIRAAR